MGFKDKKFVKPSKASANEPSCHLYLGGLGTQMKTPREPLLELLRQFGELQCEDSDDDGIFMPEDRRFCFASFAAVESACKAFDFFTNETSFPTINATKVDVKYAQRADDEPKRSPEPECTSLSEHVAVPGLAVINDFITIEEEEAILQDLAHQSSPLWKESLSRRVQHYGFPFNYRTLMVDYAKPTPPIPASCATFTDRIAEAYQSSIAEGSLPVDSPPFQPLNQLTINEYWPGQGIASHVDTESCFGPVFFILNLQSDIVMTLTKSDPSDAPHDEETSTEEMGASAAPSSSGRVRKYLLLPARSLLVISGEARYLWAHGISPRKFDKVNGVLLPRQRRVSFTFRHVVPPGPIPTARLTSGDIETEHVVKVYDAIAVHWHHTRGKRKVHWQRVKDFLESLPSGCLVGDVGSGDGKYFGLRPDLVTIGCDRSIQLLQVSKEISHETFVCDAVALPFRSNTFDAVLCIAVLHHIATVDRRCALIRELLRIARDGADVFIQAWALEQDAKSKHVFNSQDTMVPWKLNKRFAVPPSAATSNGDAAGAAVAALGADASVTPTAGASTTPATGTTVSQKKDEKESGDDVIVYERYCHVYKEGELEDLVNQVAGCVIVDSGWDHGNWFVQLRKVSDTRLDEHETGPTAKLPFRPLHKL